jgi:hypothetical protein
MIDRFEMVAERFAADRNPVLETSAVSRIVRVLPSSAFDV